MNDLYVLDTGQCVSPGVEAAAVYAKRFAEDDLELDPPVVLAWYRPASEHEQAVCERHPSTVITGKNAVFGRAQTDDATIHWVRFEGTAPTGFVQHALFPNVVHVRAMSNAASVAQTVLHEAFHVAQFQKFGALVGLRYNVEKLAYAYPQQTWNRWINDVIEVARLYNGLGSDAPRVA